MLRSFLLLSFLIYSIPANASQLMVQQVPGSEFACDADELPIFEAPRVYDNELYFTASANERSQTQLFKTNGQSVSSFDVSPGYAVGTQSIEFQGQLYFRGDNGNGTEVFRTDGHTLTNLNLSESPKLSGPRNFVVVDDNLYFQANMFNASTESWHSYLFHTDGTTISTLANIDIDASYPWEFPVGNKLYFTANGPDGFELYRAEGRDIHQVIDVNPGLANSDPWPAGEFNGEFYFTAIGPDGRGLYRTNGDTTVQLPLRPDPEQYSGPVSFVRFGDALYFQAKEEDGYELYRTDGDSVTHLDLFPGSEGSGAATYEAQLLGDKLIVPGKGPNGGAIFVVGLDGQLLQRLDLGPVPTPPPSSSLSRLAKLLGNAEYAILSQPPHSLREFQGEIYFEGFGPDGPDLYKTDGVTLTKFELVPNEGNRYSGVCLYDAVTLGESLFFPSFTSEGYELVETDGTTTTVVDLEPGPESSNPWSLQIIGNELVFKTHTSRGTTIYTGDGSTFHHLADFPDYVLESDPLFIRSVPSVTDFIRFRDDLFFLARTEQGWRLHRISLVPEPTAVALIVLFCVISFHRNLTLRRLRTRTGARFPRTCP